MRAVVFEKYGSPDVLEMREIEKPIPKENEVLIRIHASSVTAADWRMRKPEPFLVRMMNGLLKPKKFNILGIELEGEIEAVGSKFAKRGTNKKVYGDSAQGKLEDLIFIKELVESGKLRPIIDRRLPLEEVAEAHRYVETGRKKGNVIITMLDN